MHVWKSVFGSFHLLAMANKSFKADGYAVT